MRDLMKWKLTVGESGHAESIELADYGIRLATLSELDDPAFMVDVATMWVAAWEMKEALRMVLRHAPDHDNECDRALCVRSPCWPVRARAAIANAVRR